MTDIGHNSGDVLNGTAATQLRTVVERWERLEDDKAAVLADIKELAAEARGNGYDVKILRIRKMDRAKRDEETAMLDLYMSVIGEN